MPTSFPINHASPLGFTPFPTVPSIPQSPTTGLKSLGKPLVMRLNLNQQSNGPAWSWHKNLIDSLIPIVDCGVHYVDVMCQITDAKAVEVRGMGLRLSNEVAPQMYNYGHFQVLFEDGSIDAAGSDAPPGGSDRSVKAEASPAPAQTEGRA